MSYTDILYSLYKTFDLFNAKYKIIYKRITHKLNIAFCELFKNIINVNKKILWKMFIFFFFFPVLFLI